MSNEAADPDSAIALRVQWAAANIPGFSIIDKSKSWFMKALYYGALMFLWQRRFMTDYSTTIGARIYVAKPLRGVGGLALLNHELKHAEDARRLTRPVFWLGYLFPQVLALGALGAFFNLWFLLFLLALAPWPAPFRVWAEKRGYTETYNTLKAWGVEVHVGDALNFLKPKFCGPDYWWMSWRWEAIRSYFWNLIVIKS